MKNKIDCNRLGLSLGIFFALLHLIWALLVALNFAKGFLDFILPLHFTSFVFGILPFTFINAIILAVLTFVSGYVCGWLFGAIWNFIKK